MLMLFYYHMLKNDLYTYQAHKGWKGAMDLMGKKYIFKNLHDFSSPI